MKEAITISHAGGVGDGLMFSSVIKEKYCNEFERVYLQVPRLNWLFKKLYNDTPQVKLEQCPFPKTPHKSIGFKDGVEHSSWRKLTWKRDLHEESKLYREIVSEYGEDYIILHERVKDNMNRKMIQIDRKYFENQNLPVINLDGRKGHILDYVNVLRRAKEIHVYEGSFMNLADSVTDGSVPLYGHLYCKPHYFDKEMIHHQIIENIRQNKWHKNNWNYIWKK